MLEAGRAGGQRVDVCLLLSCCQARRRVLAYGGFESTRLPRTVKEVFSALGSQLASLEAGKSREARLATGVLFAFILPRQRKAVA